MKRRLRPVLISLVVLALLFGVGAKVNKALHKKPPPPRTVTAHVGEMVVKVSETGTVQPVDKVDVQSKVAGRLLTIPIVEGQTVTKGQLIATVDRTLIDPQIASTQAQLAQDEARVQQAVSAYNLQVQQTRSAIAQARAGLFTTQAHWNAVRAGSRPQELAQQEQAVARARIELDDAKRTQARRQSLLAKGFVSQADVDAAQVLVDTAASSLDAAQQQLALLQAGPRVQDVADAQAQVDAARVQIAAAQANSGQDDVRRSDIAQARASLQQTQNNLAQLMVNLSDTRIVAPASGIVLKKYKQPNEIVQSATTGFSDAQSLVATLGSRLEVQAGINEVDIPKVRVGAPVTVRVDALPNVTFGGKVTQVAPASTNAFGDSSAGGSAASGVSKFNVKVALTSGSAGLRPGMNADVDIISARHAHAVLAPLEAIPGTGKTAVVTVLTAGGARIKKTLTLGLRNDTDVEVLNGLHGGEKILVPADTGSDRRKIDINSD